MARVDLVSHARAGWSVRLTYWFSRCALPAPPTPSQGLP